MAVPKKRKKLEAALDELPISGGSTNPSEVLSDTETPKPKKVTKNIKAKSAKVDKAFDVVDQIENKDFSGTTTALEVQRYSEPTEQGIHIQFKLDLVRLEDILDMGTPKEEKVDNSIVLDFTIPYFWNLPIINEVTKTIVRELKNLHILQ